MAEERPIGMPEYAWKKEQERLAREATAAAEAVAGAAARDVAATAQAEQEARELAAVREAARRAREEAAARARAEAEAKARAEAAAAKAEVREPEPEPEPPPYVPPPPLPPEAPEYVKAKHRERIARGEAVAPPPLPPEPPSFEPAPAPELTTREYEAYQALSGEGKFKQQVAWGVIPEGSIYVSETEHLPASAIAEMKETTPNLYNILITEGFEAYQATVKKHQAEYEEFQAKVKSEEIVHLYGETYMTKEELEKVKAETPELFKILVDPARGYKAYLAEAEKRQTAYEKEVAKFEAEVYPTLSPDLQLSYTKGKEANDFTTYNQNVAAYNLAVEKLQERVNKAKEVITEFKSLRVDEPDAYNVKRALMTRRPEVTRAAELLFDKAVIDALYERYPFLKPGYVTPPKIEWEPGAGPTKEEQKVLGITVSPALATILGVAVPAAVAEPTFLGELFILAAVGSYLAYQELKKKEGKAVLPEITRTAREFKAQEGREITTDDVTRPVIVDTAKISMAVIEPLPALIPGTKALELPSTPGYAITPLMPGIFVGTKPLEVPPLPSITVMKPEVAIPALVPLVIDVPQIMVIQAQVAVAEDELETVIIKPKIMTPTELDRLWGLTKTEAGLIALDKAVGEAYTAGEIDAKAMQSYQNARQRLLARRGQLASTVQAYTSGLQLPGATPEEIEKFTTELIASGTLPLGGTASELKEAIEAGLRSKVASQLEAATEAERIVRASQDLAAIKAKWVTEMERIAAFDIEGNRVVPEIKSVEALSEALKEYHGSTDMSREIYLAKLDALDKAINKYIGEYSPHLSSEVNSLLASTTQLALSDLQKQANQAALEAYNQALAQGMTQAQATTAAQTAAQSAIQQATQTATQQAVQTATQQATKTATKAAAKTLTNTATQTAVNTAVQTAVQTAIQTLTQTATQTATKVFIPVIPVLPEEDEAERRGVYPAGTATWKQGAWWKIIPPPYDALKPMSSRTPPAGVTVLEGTPQQTLTFIGGVVPARDISFDLGVTDGFIDVQNKRIVFKGYGRLTNVGKRIPSPTKGMSVEEAEALGVPLVRPAKPRAVKRAPKPVSTLASIVSLEGLEP